MIILLMAAGILNSSGGGLDEDRELEDILGEDYLKEPAENISMTNVTNKFDEDIVEEELSDAEANSSTMATWEIAIWTCVGLLGLLSVILLIIFVVKGCKTDCRDEDEDQKVKEEIEDGNDSDKD